MMFCALAESFIFLSALTNVIKHFWRYCWGLGFLSIFGNCIKKCQQEAKLIFLDPEASEGKAFRISSSLNPK
jgi:hypothetical protein